MTADFENQEALNEVSHKIPPEAFAVKWTGDVLIKQLGTYTFYTTSFDGSRVFIDNQLVVDNSGVSLMAFVLDVSEPWPGSEFPSDSLRIRDTSYPIS